MSLTLKNAYITSTGAHFPGAAIDNSGIEAVLGRIGEKNSRIGKRILARNGIKTRYYAMGEDGKPNTTSYEMLAKAMHIALGRSDFEPSDINMISVGSTGNADMFVPGMASMVHGEIGGGPMDILSCTGVCGAGVAALKSATQSVQIGQHKAVLTGAVERSSAYMRAVKFENEKSLFSDRDDIDGFSFLSAEFLRWMLSDGAGAFLIADTPSRTSVSLQVDWIEMTSFAYELGLCMYAGANDFTRLSVENTWTYDDFYAEAEAAGKFFLRQDVRLLEKHIVDVAVRGLGRVVDKGLLDLSEIDHFLCHYSSNFFKSRFHDGYKDAGLEIPIEKWFSNLERIGNIGSASIYALVDEAIQTNMIKPGEKILLMVPESGRFSVSYFQLTAVAP